MMVTSTFVQLPKAVHDFISRWAEAAYPNEGCGLLIGRFAKGGGKEAVRLTPLRNILVDVKQSADGEAAAQDVRLSTLPTERFDKPERGFAFDPAEYNREVMKAEGEGLDVIGIVHTHPDHPPRPSAIDASQPFLAQWSNIIVSVEKGKTRDMKSWFRETDDQPFDEEDLRII
jgi:proteasome lid subunit RPN8/RPN11